MPINKDALNRFRIIDKKLSDPYHDYTTEEIHKAVNNECPNVSLRMVQKDIKAIRDVFNKEIERHKGGRGTVRYVDQSQPVFYKELTDDEEEILREVLSTLGQFDGLDNFTWLDMLKKKLGYSSASSVPRISFSKNEGLQIPDKLLGRLFTAISRKKVIHLSYTPFNKSTIDLDVYPYQLKQFNDRWFLLCTPLANKDHEYNPSFIATFSLDRMSEKIEYVEDEPYVETSVDLARRFEEMVGVTFDTNTDVEEVVIAVGPKSLPYIQTKYIHNTQMQIAGEWEKKLREKYKGLTDCTFFSFECRPNEELYSRLASFSNQVTVVEPVFMREEIKKRIEAALQNYLVLE